jgi:hypothetical protein
MANRVQEILSRLSGAGHRGGAFSSDVLIAISNVLPDWPTVSLETGCGKSTIMFSNLSSKHYVFAYDDRDQPDSSVLMVQNDPAFDSSTTEWVYGPTQRTLPVHRFPDGLMFDVMLIDGPHGYPFPDLEYALLYDRLKPGGILILDDVHIPSIGNMYDLLREDRMYDDIGVFSTTGLLRRTAIEGVPSDGDHWFEQNYNVSRFPAPMDRYRPDRSARPGRPIDLRDPATLARHALKALEPAPDGEGARTIDLGASLEFDLEGAEGRPLTVEISYRSLYPDAAEGAVLALGRQSFPLPHHPAMATERFRFGAPATRQVRLHLLHPNAQPDHDRGVTRYDFRRPGSVIERLLLTPDGVAPPATVAALAAALPPAAAVAAGQVPDAAEFRQVIETYAGHFPYSDGSGQARSDAAGQSGAFVQAAASGPLYRLLGARMDWHFGEFLPFEGPDFAEAVARSLCLRPATVQERKRFENDWSAPSKVGFVLEFDHQNRKDGSPVRVHGLKSERRVWRTARYFERKRMKLLQRWTAGLFRKLARGRVRSLMLDTSQRQLLLAGLGTIQEIRAKEGRS